MNKIKILFLITFAAYLFSACTTLTLSPAEFGWPIESVLKVDDNGTVKADRYSLSFNTRQLFFEETQDSMAYTGKSIRLIRSAEGYYFMTSPGFKNVYVFSVDKNSFTLEKKLEISQTGFTDPVFNQRTPFIELIDEGNTYNLTSEGFDGGKK